MCNTKRKNDHSPRLRLIVSVLALCATLLAAGDAHADDGRPIRVCATLTDLGALAREVGGDEVSVTTFTEGPENPHFIEARPSFVKAMSQADLYIQGGMEMEVGYAPVLIQQSRNARVLQGGRGFLDASTVVPPKGVSAGPADRSQGDVHAAGNPHYLLDPLNGLKVAALIRDRLSDLRPEKKDHFAGRYDDFRRRLGVAMVGEKLLGKYGEFEKLALLAEHGKLADFLKGQGDEGLLGGWLGRMLPHHGTKVVDEHDLWLYFADRFGLRVVGHLEPVPGVPPTTRHLGTLVKAMRQEGVRVVLSAPYYDRRHARFVADKTGAKVVTLAHQVNATEGAGDYIAMFDANVTALASALGGGQ